MSNIQGASGGTKIVLNRQSDLILDNAKITAPVGIEKSDLPGLVEDLAKLQATDKETREALDSKINAVNADITSEVARAEAAEAQLTSDLAAEVADRIADVDAEEARAKEAEAKLGKSIETEQ
ncbi:MAG: hypothetical protein EBR55_07900, partial [Chitinophagia bacterium]|nr:hypothetical protein [Chitinophagia bacterium]